MKAANEVTIKVKNYIDSHLSEELKLDQLAEMAGYSKFHLCRIFADSTGMTIHAYIRDKRLSEAAQQLIRTDQAISDIAAAYGYDSQQAFHLAFRNLYREAPSAYRRKYQLKKLQADSYKEHINTQKIKHYERNRMQMKGVLAA